MGQSIKTHSFEEVISCLTSGSTVVTAMAAAEPRMFWSQIHQHIKNFSDVKLFCSNISQPWPLLTDESMKNHSF